MDIPEDEWWEFGVLDVLKPRARRATGEMGADVGDDDDCGDEDARGGAVMVEAMGGAATTISSPGIIMRPVEVAVTMERARLRLRTGRTLDGSEVLVVVVAAMVLALSGELLPGESGAASSSDAPSSAYVCRVAVMMAEARRCALSVGLCEEGSYREM